MFFDWLSSFARFVRSFQVAAEGNEAFGATMKEVSDKIRTGLSLDDSRISGFSADTDAQALPEPKTNGRRKRARA